MVVKYSGPKYYGANVGISRVLVGPNASVQSIYQKRFLVQNINRPYLRLPNKQLIFNRNVFKTSRLKNKFKASTSNNNFFSTSKSFKQFKQKFEQDFRAKHKKNVFIKWWTITSFPLVFLGLFVRAKQRNEEEQRILRGDVDDDDDAEVHPTSWKFFAYQALPLNAVSRLWGKFNNIELPLWAREPGFKLYSYLFGVNLEEVAETDLTKYRNLSEFFYRQLKPEARPIDANHELVSPSDGKVLSLGMINEKGEIEQVKGMNYSVKRFLGVKRNGKYLKQVNHDEVEEESKHQEFAQINGISYTIDDLLGINEKKQVHHFLTHLNVTHQGDQVIKKNVQDSHLAPEKVIPSPDPFTSQKLFYAVIYLAPGDYHRFHSPVNWVCQVRKYFTGELYSVSPYFQKTFANLFILNERVSLLGYWKHGFFSMTPVGATNVGSIKINFDKELVTNKKYDPYNNNEHFSRGEVYEGHYFNNSSILKGIPLKKGSEMGGFQLGSTVVLVFEAPEKDFQWLISSGDVVKMGQPLGDVRD